MTMVLHDAGNGGLFDILGRGFHLLETLNTALLTTVPAELEDYLDEFQTKADATLPMEDAFDGLPAALVSWQSNASVLTSAVRTSSEGLLIQFVAADANQPNATLLNALNYLISQMIDDTEAVDANAISLSLTPDGANDGDTVVVYSEKRGDGLVNELILAETMVITVTSDTNPSAPSLTFVGTAAVTNKLAHNWPGGSGISVGITANDPASSLLSNGDFEDTTIANQPDNWIIAIGTPGTTVLVTNPEVQTVAIAGTPTGGGYILQFTNPAGVMRATELLSFDATATTVQTALRRLPGLGAVTASSSGTSPDLTHTVTFTGVAGNLTQMTSVSQLTGGTPSITHGTTTQGSDGAYKGRALQFVSNGSQLTTIYHPLTLQYEAVYFCHVRMKRSGAISAGDLRLEIVDEIGGNVTVDAAGNSNSLTVDPATLGNTTHDSKWFSFRLKRDQPQPVYLRIRTETAMTNGTSVYFDEMAIVLGTELYPSGPYASAFAGATAAVKGDNWTLACTNDRAGELQTWCDRMFDLAAKRLLLPTAGSTTIPDSVIG